MLISDLNHLESVEASQVQGGTTIAGITFNNNVTSVFNTTSTITETEVFDTSITSSVDINGITASGGTTSEGSSDAGNNVATKQESVFITIEQGGVTGSKSVGIGFSGISRH
ncbi:MULTISPECIES: hypothetical protein [Moorena]|uniref:Uncharacterized protein n=1 Tax=Moorena producens 3L TaxID=489825 RepID=F4Y346_9CYAN|nr:MULTISPECIES: hypothetical protein [Moorena]NES83803.1 hypothetical protein [Moorena sp. SIO2B7]EGJ28522.1 hypothetical protein LYNGBM3L_71780 [Moorena producens 3L]NEP32170.1 hypothetical protein [Moorena sp. SIO3B2]NEP67281.1 hypothetical protein [Moorena sp. SIO3A5]NEQ05593.1 hypothetical protein [Moorena sp. SIO4E2]